MCPDPIFSGNRLGVSLISQYFGSSALPGPPALALQPQVRNDSTTPPSAQLGQLRFWGKLKSRSPQVLLRGAQAWTF